MWSKWWSISRVSGLSFFDYYFFLSCRNFFPDCTYYFLRTHHPLFAFLFFDAFFASIFAAKSANADVCIHKRNKNDTKLLIACDGVFDVFANQEAISALCAIDQVQQDPNRRLPCSASCVVFVLLLPSSASAFVSLSPSSCSFSLPSPRSLSFVLTICYFASPVTTPLLSYPSFSPSFSPVMSLGDGRRWRGAGTSGCRESRQPSGRSWFDR